MLDKPEISQDFSERQLALALYLAREFYEAQARKQSVQAMPSFEWQAREQLYHFDQYQLIAWRCFVFYSYECASPSCIPF